MEILSADDQAGEGTQTARPRDIESTKARLFGEDASDHLRKQMAKARFMQALVQPSAGTETRDIREGATQPTSPRELTVESVQIGRYSVLRKLGEGGMGVVYAAYDEQLDRKIALKLLRGDLAKDERGRVRIRREAQALARLSHPNVVQVHEIGSWREHDYVAMEFVSGQTLDRWLRAKPRHWTESLEILLQAGRGLAAAHAAELVHRDFKPANVIVGDDGRARVLDFGLARAAEDCTTNIPLAQLQASEPGSEGDPAATPTSSGEVERGSNEARSNGGTTHGDSGSNVFSRELTATGSVLGTWVYMAPEQHLGQRATPASDQFSFCFVLYHALFGKWPFEGESRTDHAQCAVEGRFEVPGPTSGVPAWLRKAVCRGLAPVPSNRWPSMDALLAELSRDRESMWKRSIVAGGLIGCVGLALLLGQREQESPPELCRDIATVVDSWTPTEQASVQQAFEASGLTDAGERLGWATRDLDRYAAALAEGYTGACTDHRITQVQTEAQFELRIACLDERNQQLRAAVAELAAGDAAVVRRAPEIVAGLGDVDMCAQVELLDQHSPAPKDEAARQAIAQVRERLIEGHTARRAGRLQAADAIAIHAREETLRLEYRPLLGEVAQLEAELAFARRDYETAKDKALEVWSVSRDPERRLDAMLRIARVQMETQQDAEVELALAATEAERLGAPPSKQAMLHGVQGDALRLAGQFPEALREYDRAVALAEGENFVGREYLLATALVVRASVQDSLGRHDAAHEDRERALSLDDVNTIDALFNQGVQELAARHFTRAEALLSEAIGDYERVFGARHPQIGHGQLALAQIAIAREQYDEAERLISSARDLLAAYEGDLVYVLDAQVSLLLARDQKDAAIELLTHAVGIGEPADLAYLRGRLGQALAEDGKNDEALIQLDQAIATLDDDEHPTDIVPPLTHRGRILRELGQLEGSLESLERAVAFAPIPTRLPLQAAEARVQLALTLAALGNETRARDVAFEAFELVAGTPDERDTLDPVSTLLPSEFRLE